MPGTTRIRGFGKRAPGAALAAFVAFVATLVAGAPRPAHALGPLDVVVEDASPREARVDTGLQNGFVVWAGYGQRLPRLLLDRPLAFEVRFGMPYARPDFGDSALEGGLQIDVWGHGRWRLRDQLDVGERTTSNPVFDAFELLVRDTLSFGWQARGGGFGVDLGWEQGLATHLHQSNFYQGEIYPDAKDGWIAFPSGRLHVGLYGGFAIGGRIFLAARLGYDRDRTGRGDLVPLAGTLTGAYRF
jgi:hypothetical protein